MPAPVMTYSSLFADVQSYLNRETDAQLSSYIPEFIQLAQVRIAREVKTLGFKTVYTSSFVATSAVIAKPARWRQTIGINVGTGSGNNTRSPLYPRGYEFCRQYWPNDTITDSTQPPRYYADYDYDHWLVVPTPYTSYPFEVSVYEQPVPISDIQSTNWITENAPDLLTYACLIQAEPWVKNFELIESWKDQYSSALAALMGEDTGRKNDMNIKRTEGNNG